MGEGEKTYPEERLRHIALPLTRTKEERFRFLEDEAATYDEREAPYCRAAEDFRSRTIELLGEISGRILEIGCATGRLTSKLPRAWTFLVCIDVSMGKLRLARRRTGRGPCYLQADMEHLPFKEGTFDLVLSHYALHHSFNHAGAISESVLVTRHSGRLFYVVPRGSDDPEERRREIEASQRFERLRGFTVSEFRGMVDKGARLVASSREDFTSKVWGGRVLFLDLVKNGP